MAESTKIYKGGLNELYPEISDPLKAGEKLPWTKSMTSTPNGAIHIYSFPPGREMATGFVEQIKREVKKGSPVTGHTAPTTGETLIHYGAVAGLGYLLYKVLTGK